MPDFSSAKAARADEESGAMSSPFRDGEPRVFRKWSCPRALTIAAYTDGVLGGPKRGWVEFHLARCAWCRLLVADIIEAGRETEMPAAPAELVQRAISSVERRPASRKWLVWAPAGALAAVTLVTMLVGPAWHRTEELTIHAPSAPAPPLIAEAEPPPSPAVTTPRREIVRGTEQTQLLSVVVPRNGSVIRSHMPEFIWTPIPQSRHYEVRVVRSDGEPVWKGETEKAGMQLPADLQLQSGVYFVWITASLGDGHTTKSSPVRFRVSR